MENVAPIQGTGTANPLHRPKGLERGGDRFGFRPAGCGSRPGDHRELIQHQRGVLHEHPVGKLGSRREPLEGTAGIGEGRYVLLMLADGPGKVDRDPVEMTQLAVSDGRTRVPNQRGDQGRGAVASRLL